MRTRRATLFGTKKRLAMTAGVAMIVLIGLGFASGLFGLPSVVGTHNAFGAVNDSTTEIETDLIVNNPNPIGASFGGVTVNYTVSMNGIAMANGTKDGLRFGTGNSTLEFTTLMRNEKIAGWWVSHLRNSERTELRISARVHSSTLGQSLSVPHTQDITTDIIGQFNSTETRPVNANQPLVSDPILYINRTGARWGSVTQAETPIDLAFVVFNPKTIPYTITEIGYEITMNNVSVGEGRSEDPYVIPGRTEKTIETTTLIENQALDEWWVSHLERDQVTALRIVFYARVELPTGTPVRIPLDALTYTKRIETDFFGTKPETSTSNSRPDGTTASGPPTDTPPSTTAGVFNSPSPARTTPATETPRTAVPTPTETDANTTTPPDSPTPDDPIDILGNETDTLPTG